VLFCFVLAPASLLIGGGAVPAKGQCVSFAAPVSYPAGQAPDSIASSDLDGDGDLDLVATDSFTNLVYLFFNDGQGGFPVTTLLSGIPRKPNSISIADLDNDGHDDLIVGFGASNPGFEHFPLAGLAVYSGLGNGQFQEPTLYDAGGPVVSTELGDIDNDGYLDVLGAHEGGSAYTLFFNNGKFPSLIPLDTPHPIDPNLVNGFDETAIVLAPGGSRSPLLVDLDLDGDLDIAVGNRFFFVVTLLYNDGEGGFSPQESLVISVDSFVLRVATGDLNGDHAVDLVMSMSQFAVRVFLNTGDRTYDLLPSIGGFSNSTDIHLVDFTNDGILDVLTANPDLNEFRILPGRGGGVFGASQNIPSGGLGPRMTAIGDFNSDGALDVATANSHGSGDISVHLNAGFALNTSNLNDDGRVNGIDLAQLLQSWGDCENGFPCSADLNCDQQVNGLDLATLLTNWGPVM